MSVERIEVPVDPAVFAAWNCKDLGDEGATFGELKAIWKCGDRVARGRLRDAQKAGVLNTGWRVINDIAGRTNRAPVYSFITLKKKKARM